jgi:hypothetical protein
MATENMEEFSLPAILQEIRQKQEEFYEKTKKHIFFKKAQKEECAKFISSHYSLEILIQSTLVVDKESNQIIFYYPVFKLYINPDNYKQLITYMIKTFSECSRTNKFTLILDADSITPTALERYSYFIGEYRQQYEEFKKSFYPGADYSSNIEKIRIINVNSFFENFKSVIRPFCEADVYGKIEFVGKV